MTDLFEELRGAYEGVTVHFSEGGYDLRGRVEALPETKKFRIKWSGKCNGTRYATSNYYTSGEAAERFGVYFKVVDPEEFL